MLQDALNQLKKVQDTNKLKEESQAEKAVPLLGQMPLRQ